LAKLAFPKAQHMLGKIKLVGHFADGAKGMVGLIGHGVLKTVSISG
jgi:hypothetical protein